MKNSRKFILTSLCGLAAIGIYACGANGRQGEQGAAGAKGDSCSVVTNADGTATIKCTDGSSFNIVNGKDANPADAGSDGKEGQDGKSCYLTENSDGSAAVVCPYDGSSYIVRGNTDNYANYCKDGFWGKNCENECNCQNDGICNDGVTGDGSCTCAAGWDGPNCDKCAAGWDGQNCDECADDLSGAHCDLPKTCKNGTPNLGVNGNGECSSCFDKWDGPNCDKCPAGFYDGVTKCIDCTKGGANSAFGTDKCTFTDIRTNSTKTDQNTYKVVTINGKFWMAENLKAQLDVNGNEVNCYANTNADQYFVEEYGCLYTWEDAKKVCPSGWKLPEQKDFEQLLTTTGADSDSSSIRASSLANGSDSSGFGALPAGFMYSSGDFDDFGSHADFWSATPFGDYFASVLIVRSNDAVVSLGRRDYAFSVRCLRDEG